MYRQYYGGVERQETDEAKANRILAEEMKRRKWRGEELQAQRKGDKEKVKMAKRLRGETTMTLNWIAQRLAMGAPGFASQGLRETRKRKQHAILRDPLFDPFSFWRGGGLDSRNHSQSPGVMGESFGACREGFRA